MRYALFVCVVALAACGADGPPTTPPAQDATAETPPVAAVTKTDRPPVDADLARPVDAADTTEEI